MKEIVIKCEAKERACLDELREFQGNLKSLTEQNYLKLKNQIIRHGFSFPVFIWKSDTDGSKYILDGHQRYRTLTKLQSEGYHVPDIPVAVIEAESYGEAKQKLLAAASQYGDIEPQGLYEFMAENSLEPDYIYDNFKLADTDFNKFHQEFFEMSSPDIGDYQGKELDEQDFDKFDHQCPKCGFEWDDKKKK